MTQLRDSCGLQLALTPRTRRRVGPPYTEDSGCNQQTHTRALPPNVSCPIQFPMPHPHRRRSPPPSSAPNTIARPLLISCLIRSFPVPPPPHLPCTEHNSSKVYRGFASTHLRPLFFLTSTGGGVGTRGSSTATGGSGSGSC